jgi:hypothetical protein
MEEIKQLKARYFRALDSKDWASLAKTYTSKIRAINPRTGVDNFHSREEQAELVRKLVGNGRSIHHGYHPEIVLVSDDHATGIWAMDDLIVYPPKDNPKGFRGWGYYYEEYRIEDGEWRIAAMELRRIRFEPLPGGLPDSVLPSLLDQTMIWMD